MKKRNLLVALLLVFTMLLSACGASDPFVGKWKGNCDLTDYIMDMMEEEYADYMEYIHFENLAFDIDFTFEDGNVTMKVDEASVDAFVANVEVGIRDMMYDMIVDGLMQNYKMMFDGVETLDDVAALSNGEYADGQAILDSIAMVYSYATFDEYMDATVEAMNMGGMLEPMCEALNLSGTYEYDEEAGVLTLYYEDDTYEEMQYKFTDDTLMIRVSDGTVDFDIECEKVGE